jgi:hypothetical protein
MPIIVQNTTPLLWEKVKFFWQQAMAGMTMAATSEEAGFAKENVYDLRESSLWKATSAADQYLTFDAGVGKTYAADYLAIANHNLFGCDALLVLQFAGDDDIWTDAFAPFVPASDKPIVVEFDQSLHRKWRVKLTSLAAAPFMAISIFGQKTELGYTWGSFDPNAHEIKDNIFTSDTGYLLGISRRYTEAQINLRFGKVRADLYAKFLAWREGCGLGNFFLAWETSQHPADVLLVRADAQWNHPISGPQGTYREVSLKLIGRTG